MNWFRPPVSGHDWFSVGQTSTFPNLGADDTASDLRLSCKAFHVPPSDSSKSTEVSCRPTEDTQDTTSSSLQEQVLVFQYKGKFHAIDHVSQDSDPVSSLQPV
jgi:hypothetical protein